VAQPRTLQLVTRLTFSSQPIVVLLGPALGLSAGPFRSPHADTGRGPARIRSVTRP
jgi:hypothetical protein